MWSVECGVWSVDQNNNIYSFNEILLDKVVSPKSGEKDLLFKGIVT